MVGEEEIEYAQWRKSSWSGSDDGGCVSVAVLPSPTPAGDGDGDGKNGGDAI
jgi:Domain of unknown function (DUF397)